MNSFVATFLGPLPYFRLGLKHVAKLCSGFSKEIAMDRAMDYVSSSGIVGDYLEFGVWRGRAFAAACYLSRQRKLSMKFYAFDSFNGLPENKEVDATGHQMFRGGNYRCSEQEFLKNVRHTGADMSHVITVPGWFRESLRPDNPRISALQKAAVVWVDCDLYSSCVDVLRFVSSYLQHGTLICFDDWFNYRADPNAGEQRAFREWLESNPHLSAVELMRVGWEGNCFVIHRIEESKALLSRSEGAL